LTDDRRRTTPRRELEADPRVAELSPEVGEIDDDALEALADEDLDAALEALAAMAGATDRKLAALAAKLAGRLVLDVARAGPVTARGLGRMVTLPADRAEGDLDLDASMDGLVAARTGPGGAALDELRVRSWRRPATALSLVVDRSGSMNGHRLATAAVAAAAVAWRTPDDWSMLAFGEHIVAVKSQQRDRAATGVVDDVLALRGTGTTDLAAALRSARDQLDRSTATRRITVLLSDCRATAGDDPVPVARGLDELVILAPADDADDARALASATGARLALIDGPAAVPGALGDLL